MKSAICIICGESFLARTKKTIRCPKPECRKAHKAMLAREWRRRKGSEANAKCYAAKKSDPLRWEKLLARKRARRREIISEPRQRKSLLERTRRENREHYRRRKQRRDDDPIFDAMEAARKRKNQTAANRKKRENRAQAEATATMNELIKRQKGTHDGHGGE